jgi:molecular chaperone DnaJ
MTASAMQPLKAAWAAAAAPGRPGRFRLAFSDVFEDLFGDFMGGGGGAAAAGRARAARVGPALQPARHAGRGLSGVQKTITVPTSVTCDVCRGSGAEGGPSP